MIGLLGAGGMGEVYRAKDTKLNRDVALKVLSDLVLSDPDRLARFQREAQVLASLNHPNIGQIYGVEDRALVLELVEGPTLEEVIYGGPSAAPHAVPLHDALRIASQVALALEAAHERGIIHRDLKPSNIKVKDDGTVKVLDFGLAKALAPESGSGATDLANSPTLTARATQLGMILGTAAYMSPEQARGKTVDRRADVWAFGVVLYEMLTGRRAFDGSEVSDVLASVLKDSLTMRALPSGTPASIRRLLRRCLEKDRANRLDSMATARLEIADAMLEHDDGPTQPAVGSMQPAVARRRVNLAMVGVSIATLAIGLAGGWILFRAPSAKATTVRTVRFALPLPAGVLPTAVAVTSTDTVIYEAGRLYARGLADTDPKPLDGTEGARNLFLSPDGRWIGFYQGDYDQEGGRRRRRCPHDCRSVSRQPRCRLGSEQHRHFHARMEPSARVRLGRWRRQTRLAHVGRHGGWRTGPLVARVDARRQDRPLYGVDGGVWYQRLAHRRAGRRHGQASRDHAGRESEVHCRPPALLLRGRVSHRALRPRCPAPDRRGQKILTDAMPLDPGGSRVKPVAVSADGTLAYLAGALDLEGQLAWLTPAGVVESINVAPQRYGALDLSPDGRQLASSRVESGSNGLWLTDLVRLTDEKLDAPGTSFAPVWSPTGDFLAFTSMRAGHFDVSTIRPGERAKVVIGDPFDQTPSAISKDGKVVLLKEYYSDGTVSLGLAELDRPQERKRLAISGASIGGLALSPDDQWLAMVVSASGRPEIVVQPFQRTGPVVRVTPRGGFGFMWSKKSSTLYYVRDEELVAATYSTAGGRFSIAREETIARPGPFRLAGVAPDGRFLIVKLRPGQMAQLQVIVNWLHDMK